MLSFSTRIIGAYYKHNPLISFYLRSLESLETATCPFPGFFVSVCMYIGVCVHRGTRVHAGIPVYRGITIKWYPPWFVCLFETRFLPDPMLTSNWSSELREQPLRRQHGDFSMLSCPVFERSWALNSGPHTHTANASVMELSQPFQTFWKDKLVEHWKLILEEG